MGFFRWYVNILGSQIHVFSILAVSCCLFSITYAQKKHPIYIRIINSLLLLLLGHFIYEDIFIFIMGTVGRSIDALGLYVAVTIGIVAMIIIVNKQYPSYEFDKSMFWLLSALLSTFAFMYYVGWFRELQVWYTGGCPGCPDPHNWLWAISKVLGFIVPVPLLRGENLR